jgi:CHAD domain-containing protein
MAADATQHLLPAGIGLDAAVERLGTGFDLTVGAAATVERTFYDTFDGRLHAAGLALIAQDGRLIAVTVPSYIELAGVTAQPGERLFASDLPSGRLRELLEPIVEVRALGATARTRGQVIRIGVCNDDAKTVVRLVLEAPEAVGNGGQNWVDLRTRVHVVAVRGYDRALQRVRRTLAGKVGLEVSELAAHAEAIVSAGGLPGGYQTKLDLRLSGRDPAAAGAATAFGEMLRVIELTLPGTLADIDTEFLHDLRVAVRRTRSVQRQLGGAFPQERWRWFRDEFRWLGQVTGPTRDLDVLLIDFGRLGASLPSARAGELEPLGGLLRRQRAVAYERMVAELESERTRTLLAEWAEFLRTVPAATQGGPSLSEIVGGRIRAVYRAMRRAGEAIDEATPAERLHDLRKQGKELRYLLETFSSLFAADAVRPTVKSLKALQETLGEFQDREVQANTLRGLGGELATVAGGPAALLALGVVLERVEAESMSARGEFAERFAVFAGAGQRALIRDGFR